MDYVKYDFGYMFAYSERPGTLGAKKFEDDISQATKKKRLQEIIDVQQKHSRFRTEQHLGNVEEVLVEKESKKSNLQWSGRNTQNTTVVFPKQDYKLGDYVLVKMKKCTSVTLIGEPVGYGPMQVFSS
jgi:tRNA-2-methylthio-N6-dimethylallyladenosine synthase